METSINAVQTFWDENPLLTGELEAEVGTAEWFREFDQIKFNEGLAGDLSLWIPEDIEGKRVLDIGCGPGYWNRIFGKMNVEYYGIDISPRTIEIARKSKAIFNLHGTLEVGNAEHLEFPNESFDLVVSEGVIHHTPDTQACVNEIHRVLRKGGNAHIGLYYKNLVLRSRFLFRLILWIMKVYGISLKGRGREGMAAAQSPEELVRMYDGLQNPIGKAYTKTEIDQMFRAFEFRCFKRYYFPSRALRLHLPSRIQHWLNSTLGLMIMVKASK